MRLATFNLESLDLSSDSVPLDVRAEVLRPALERLQADILCLQEVNGQHVVGHGDRVLAALDWLLATTGYAGYARVATTGGKGHGAAAVHNLVTLSRFPIRAHRELLHELVVPPRYQLRTAIPPTLEEQPIRFDRPVLVTHIDLPGGDRLAVVNLHLRAPLAVSIAGQKLEPFVWRTVSGWAEGYFLSAVRRAAQALEVRFLLEQLFDAEDHSLIAVAGDFNAEDHEVPVRIIAGAEEQTGNPTLAGRSLVVLDRAIPRSRRWSVLHHGQPEMLDHILASHTLYGRFKTIEVHNETLRDELAGHAGQVGSSASNHAPVVAEFVGSEQNQATAAPMPL
jgi:endonuclease/exonuclease/phosphatase family metal-dependent hydrolase